MKQEKGGGRREKWCVKREKWGWEMTERVVARKGTAAKRWDKRRAKEEETGICTQKIVKSITCHSSG